MALSQKVQRLDGVVVAMVGMGTPLNLDILENLKFKTTGGEGEGEGSNASANANANANANASAGPGPNDLIIAIRAESSEALEKALVSVEEMMNNGGKKVSGENQAPLRSYVQAKERQDCNLVLISVPGAYAAREARKALEENLNVMLFSDNVSLEDEVRLKRLAHEKGLLLMGPDCGTAIINGVPLAFANLVRRGVIGVVGASGTGTQEVTVQIDRMGEGLSQVLGTGGRDLKEAVGGFMMLDGIEALKQDPETKVIVVVSKPAAPLVADKVFQALKECGKPSVLYVIGAKETHVNVIGDRDGDGHVDASGSGNANEKKNVHVAKNLLEAAQIATKLAGGTPAVKGVINQTLVVEKVSNLKPGQKYVRGLFSGGTLCDETMEVLTEKIGLIYSNGPLDPAGQLENPNVSVKNTILDLGDDYFTVGRPHPMIDLSLRIKRLEEEAADAEVAVILLDIVLGYGSHINPALEMVPAIQKAQMLAAQAQREIIFVAYVCGSAQDPQGTEKQTQQFRDAGVLVFPSNVEAAEFTGAVISHQVNDHLVEGGEK